MSERAKDYMGPRQLRAAEAADLKSPDWVIGGQTPRQPARTGRDMIDEMIRRVKEGLEESDTHKEQPKTDTSAPEQKFRAHLSVG